MDAITTVSLKGVEYLIECPICYHVMTKGPYILPCSGYQSQKTHPRICLECVQKCAIQAKKIFDEKNAALSAEGKPLLEVVPFICPVDSQEIQVKNGEFMIRLDTELSEAISLAFPTSAASVDSHSHHQPIPHAPERRCPPALGIAAGLFLLSAIAYAVNHLCFAGASAILAVAGFPASLVIIPLVYLLQQVVQLLIAAVQIITVA